MRSHKTFQTQLKQVALATLIITSCPLIAQNLGSKGSARTLNTNTNSERAQKALLNAPAPREINIDFLNSLGAYFHDSKEHELIPLLESMGVDTLNSHPELLFLLGLAYQSNYQFEDAISTLRKSKSIFSPNQLKKITPSEAVYDQVNSLNRNWVTEKGEVKFMDRIIEKKINECNNAIVLSATPKKVKISNPGKSVNSEFVDFGPVFRKSDSTLFFTSRRPETVGGNTFNDQDEYYEDIYFASKKSTSWESAKNIGRPLNGRKHDAVVGATSGGDTLFVYCGRNGGNLLYSTLDEDGKYLRPRKIGNVVNSEFTERSLTMSPNQQFIVFERDNDPSGLGGGDLYQSRHLGNDEWSEPMNLGQPINTEFDEDAAFLAEDGKTLFFSSKGHNSMGGFDIFYSVRENGKWSTPKNMGTPVNSPKDDIYFNMSPKKDLGYFSSNRKSSMGQMDIFKAEFNPAPKIELITLKGNVTNNTTNESEIAYVTIRERKKSTQPLIEEALVIGNYFSRLEAGKTYRISAKAEGFEEFYRTLTIPSNTFKQTISLDIALIPEGKPKFNDGLFAYNKSRLSSSHKEELSAIARHMKKNENLILRIEGHADNVGSKSYNLKLSEDRAQKAYKYLVRQGITTDRLSWKAFGELEPVAPNTIGGDDNPLGRALNRRNEFVFSWDIEVYELVKE